MSNPPNEPHFVTCRCQHCDKGIEFDAGHEGELVACPHCGMETKLFLSPAMTERTKYFLWIDEKQAGPYDQQQIRDMVKAGEITALVLGHAADGSGEWSQIGSLFNMFPGSPAKSTPPPLPAVPRKTKGLGVIGILGICFASIILGVLGLFMFLNLTPKTWKKSDSLQSGEVSIKIARLYINSDFIPNGIGMGVTPSENLFHIRIIISNLSKTQKIDFVTWRSTPDGDSSKQATLSDNYGNYYKAIMFDPLPEYLKNEATIYPGQEIQDIVVFQNPVEGAKWFHLELPANNFGQSGTIRFEIPPNIYSTPLF
jgi:transcription elongation factor Elf1